MPPSSAAYLVGGLLAAEATGITNFSGGGGNRGGGSSGPKMPDMTGIKMALQQSQMQRAELQNMLGKQSETITGLQENQGQISSQFSGVMKGLQKTNENIATVSDRVSKTQSALSEIDKISQQVSGVTETLEETRKEWKDKTPGGGNSNQEKANTGGGGGGGGGRSRQQKERDFKLQDLAGTGSVGTAMATIGESGVAVGEAGVAVGETGNAVGSGINDIVTGTADIIGRPEKGGGGLLGASYNLGDATNPTEDLGPMWHGSDPLNLGPNKGPLFGGDGGGTSSGSNSGGSSGEKAIVDKFEQNNKKWIDSVMNFTG